MASAEPSISKGSSRSSTRPRRYKTAEVLTKIFNDSDSNDDSDSDDSDVPTSDLESWGESDIEDSDEGEEEVVQQSSVKKRQYTQSLSKNRIHVDRHTKSASGSLVYWLI